MRQVSVHLSVIAIILLVIFAHGNQNIAGYLSQNIHKGQSVFVQDEQVAFVNDEFAPVLHTGFTYSDSFFIQDIIDLNGTEFVYLDHSVSGVFDEPAYRFNNITGGSFNLEENITLDAWELTYVGSFTDANELTAYVYNYSNFTVAVSTDDFAVVQDGGRSLLLQQADGSIQANEIEEPFSIGVENIAFLISFIVVVGIVAYWGRRRFIEGKDWRITNE